MSTAASWSESRRAVADLRALLAFRRSGLTPASARRLRVAGWLAAALTAAAIAGPAYLAGPTPRENAGSMLALLPSFCLGFLALTIFSAVAAGGGREVVPPEQGVAFPVSSATDHLGALLLAPLNIAWFAQAWSLLGAASYALGPDRLLAYELPLVLWVLVSTALAQAVGWAAEGVRRGPRGPLVIRGTTALLGAGAVTLVLTGTVASVLDHSPTSVLLDWVLAGATGRWGPWLVGVAVLLALGVGATAVGAWPARWALHRPMREELRLESGRHPARPLPTSDLAMALRVDRAAVWRSVPLRRGLAVLSVMPGAVALAGRLEWHLLTVLPGLVASGAALLFGVNTWCLDGRGALWRESLPVSPRLSYWSRVWVQAEVLLGAAAVTLLLAALGAGVPTPGALVALVAGTVVVTLQVVGASMRWSIARPFATDLRSARATPAPPVVMVGYSARLAIATTVTGLVFSGLALQADVGLTLAVSACCALWSAWRLERAAGRWSDPEVRARVVVTVAG